MAENDKTKATGGGRGRSNDAPDSDGPKKSRPSGVHLAYSADKSEFFHDSSENKVLRHAVRHGMRYVFWPFGTTLSDAIAKGDAEAEGA